MELHLVVMFARMQRVEVGDTIDAEHRRRSRTASSDPSGRVRRSSMEAVEWRKHNRDKIKLWEGGLSGPEAATEGLTRQPNAPQHAVR